jgi:hypothetical protein
MPAAGDPVYTSDITDITGRPVGRIVASGTQALADNTQVAIEFSGGDTYDTSGAHSPSTNNTRVTPTVEGYYRFYGTVFFAAQSTPVVSDVCFRLNGTTNLAPGNRSVPSTQAFSLSCTTLRNMNGTTDYVELMARQDSAGADDTNQSSQFSSVLEWEYLRP